MLNALRQEHEELEKRLETELLTEEQSRDICLLYTSPSPRD